MIIKVSQAIQPTPTFLKIVASQSTCAHKKQVIIPYSYSLVTPTEAGVQMSSYIEQSFIVQGDFYCAR